MSGRVAGRERATLARGGSRRHALPSEPADPEEHAMRTANPALNDDVFRRAGTGFAIASDRMTVQGTVHKTLGLAVACVATAAIPWTLFMRGDVGTARLLMIGGAIAGLIVAIVLAFKTAWAPVLAPVYALLEGLFLGGVSAVYASMYQGIVVQAAGLTVMTLVAMLVAYRTGLIKVTDKLRLGIVAATGGIFLLYLVGFVLRLFGVSIPFIHESGPIGIAFSLFVVGIAALNLVLDFDFIERGAASGAPKSMEWYGAFGLLVTLVWLYIEMLRLLSKLRSR
jgi:uncharacterized YccA/Bax inhibitor family protein